MRIHFIAIGGSIMHQLAIWLSSEGHEISGSDDIIYEPALSNLHNHNLLPKKLGFSAKNLDSAELVIFGMHSGKNNPEYLAAKEQGIKIMSFAEYFYTRISQKTRIVIAGSHGKTTTTAMLAHMFIKMNKSKFDLLIGAQIPTLEHSVQLYPDAEFSIIEGDEYPASTNNLIPKFLYYKAHIAVITGIAWDHINVFPSFEIYKKQFINFILSIEPNGTLIYNALDAHISEIIQEAKRHDLKIIPYTLPKYYVESSITYVNPTNPIALAIFGKHNLSNLMAALEIGSCLGWGKPQLLAKMQDFTGVSKRMQCLVNSKKLVLYRDFAHAPSKVEAALDAFCNQFLNRELFLCLELHTYSSLNETFLKYYITILEKYPKLLIYYSITVLHAKKSTLSITKLSKILNIDPKRIIDNPTDLYNKLLQLKDNTAALLMSSGNFDNLKIPLEY